MTQKITRDYYIGLGELREIIQKYFKDKTGEEVALCNINVDIKEDAYTFPKFKQVHISIEEVK